MFFIPIIAGWALGVTSAKLIDSRRRTMVQIANTFYAPAHNIDGTSAKSVIEAKAHFDDQDSVTVEPSIKKAHYWHLFQEELPTLGASTTELVKRPVRVVHKIKRETIDPFFEDMRTQHMKEISLDEEVISEEQKFAERRLKFFSALLISTATCALLYPPLIFLHIPGMLYLQIPFYKRAYQELLERGVTTTVVDAILGIGYIGYTFVYPPILLMGVINGWVYAYSQKLVVQSKDGTRKKLTHLFDQQPNYVWVVQNGVEVEVPFEAVQGEEKFGKQENYKSEQYVDPTAETEEWKP